MTTIVNIHSATRITTSLHDNGERAWRVIEIEDATGAVIEVCAFASDAERVRIQDEDEAHITTGLPDDWEHDDE